MTALVVDDDTLNRELLKRMLAKLGWDSVAVPSGKAALQRFEETSFDVVLLDYNLGDMDGRAVARAMRAMRGMSASGGQHQGGTGSVPVMVVTGLDRIVDEDGVFAGIVHKPFVLEDLRIGLATLGLI